MSQSLDHWWNSKQHWVSKNEWLYHKML